MAIHRATTTIEPANGNPDDVSTNTLHFDVDNTLSASIDAAQVAVEQFYDDISSIYSNLMTTSARTEWYQLSDAPPRRPVKNQAFTMTAIGGNPLPTECACVMSFQAEPVSGLPQARRRNRIYLGPMGAADVDTSGNVLNTVVSQIASAGGALLSASEAQADWSWAIWSPTDGQGTPVNNGWVDNSFDTQRRRGRTATGRTLFV